jgi:hypothetical protein
MWQRRQVSCDISMTAKRLGMSVTCSATLTVGLVGEVLSLLALLVQKYTY